MNVQSLHMLILLDREELAVIDGLLAKGNYIIIPTNMCTMTVLRLCMLHTLV